MEGLCNGFDVVSDHADVGACGFGVVVEGIAEEGSADAGAGVGGDLGDDIVEDFAEGGFDEQGSDAVVAD